MGGEAVVGARGEKAEAVTGNAGGELPGHRDRRGLDLRPAREKAFDHPLVFFLFEAAGRVEKESPRGEELRRGGEALFLRAGEALDRLRRHAIADLGILPQGSGPAAGSVEEHALEASRRERRRQDFSRGRQHVEEAEPGAVFNEHAQSLDGAVEGEGTAGLAVQDG